ncbi:MAG: 5'/3'-nucleotidase SurE [Bacteroidales bacterium]|nr:5'/3'-nucleotidase SurE [Bacteroidales bacterium]
MKILVTNDDGYRAQGLEALVRILQHFGEVTVVAPKYHQSGMSMAVSMGFRRIAVKDLGLIDGARWFYLDGTPASCVKYGLDNVMADNPPDVVVSGINHGANAGTAVLYSGTIGAAQEAAVNGIRAIGISLDDMRPEADFSAVEALFPSLFKKIMTLSSENYGILYNVNFPNLPTDRIKGIRIGQQGKVHWEDEYQPYDPDIYARCGITKEQMGILFTPELEPDEVAYMMAGDLTDSPGNTPDADHYLMMNGYVSVTVHNIDTTDYAETLRLRKLGFDEDFF